MAKRPALIILNGEHKGSRFEVGEGALRLGRSSSNDIHIKDEELSRNHCLFERVGEAGLRVTDLASANGTMVNGVMIGNEPYELKEGDVIEVGQQRISVGEPVARAVPKSPNGAVDLGLGSSPAAKPPSANSAPRRSPLLNLLWIVAILVAGGAIAFILFAPAPEGEAKAIGAQDHTPRVMEVDFEKVQANAEGIFRYALRIQGDSIQVQIDDTVNGRHTPSKTKTLSVAAQDRLREILAWKTMKTLDSDYCGPEPDPPALDSVRLKVVYSTGVKTVSVVNTDEPEVLTTIRENLESFSKNELGVWAIACSRETLISNAEEALLLAQTKWEDRDATFGNLHASIRAFQDVIYYLETVNPKPDFALTAHDGLKRAKDELASRYKDQRFKADRALNLSQWEEAIAELKILLEMIPDREDERHREAQQKLLAAENQIKGARK